MALPPSLMVSALVSGESFWELAGIGSLKRGGSFWQFLKETTPIAHPSPERRTNPTDLGKKAELYLCHHHLF